MAVALGAVTVERFLRVRELFLLVFFLEEVFEEDLAVDFFEDEAFFLLFFLLVFFLAAEA